MLILTLTLLTLTYPSLFLSPHRTTTPTPPPQTQTHTMLSTLRTPASSALRRTMATGKEIKFGIEGRAAMLKGVEMLADAVQVTLGPKGRNAIIDQPYGAPKITKDGVTVAKSIEFSDKYENMGAQLVRSVANKTNDAAGDGTTTATVLARAIYKEGCKAVAAGMNPTDLRRGIQAAVASVVETLGEISRDINSKDEITQVGTISANSDVEIGQLISDAMEKVGNEVREGMSLGFNPESTKTGQFLTPKP